MKQYTLHFLICFASDPTHKYIILSWLEFLAKVSQVTVHYQYDNTGYCCTSN